MDCIIGECRSRDEVKCTLDRYVKFFSKQRLCYAIGYDAPANYRERYYQGARFIASYVRLRPNRYYTVEDYYYWTMGDPVEETNILNRAKLFYYEFRETEKGVIILFRQSQKTENRRRFKDGKQPDLIGNKACK